MNIIKEIYASREETEKHISALAEKGQAGERYTLMLSNRQMLILGLIGDVGTLIMLIDGLIHLAGSAIVLKSDLLFLLIGGGYLVYLNYIHEKEICTKNQRDCGFGMILLSGILGIVCAFDLSSRVYMAGSILTIISCLIIYLSFKKGIYYGVK